ncbi:hypothetical protein P775_21080 [Puniceibacterium antarcticum]|uniref:Uncharacterized protein n=1 Tax=Puniceibacterium antarcticum TaxID=1206336 RepID=A0A2G8R9I0_9RHOB|nr:hypothetical protein P775_21080 [Puniceibacterium antarcticum]
MAALAVASPMPEEAPVMMMLDVVISMDISLYPVFR